MTRRTKKRGRPSMGKGARSRQVMVRISEAEFLSFTELAAAAQRKLSDWLRVQGLNATRRKGA